jgi:ubiquinone/menaquinone biosynthesis C-methylase UbiE
MASVGHYPCWPSTRWSSVAHHLCNYRDRDIRTTVVSLPAHINATLDANDLDYDDSQSNPNPNRVQVSGFRLGSVYLRYHTSSEVTRKLHWVPFSSLQYFPIDFISSPCNHVFQFKMLSKVSDTRAEPEKAPVYDKMGVIFATRNVAKCCAYLQPHIKPTSRILDVGCGTGSITVDLARHVPQGHVVGIDISSDSLAQATSLAKAQGITNVEFMQSDAHAIRALSDDSFDIVHSHMVLLHLSDPVLALREMRRLVKDGGIVAARDVAATFTVPEKPILAKQQKIYERIAGERGAHTDGGKHTHLWAHEAGFPWDKIEASSAGWEFSGPAARRIWVEGAKNSMRTVAIGGGYATEEEMDEMGAGWEEWGNDEGARFMGLDGQILCFK